MGHGLINNASNHCVSQLVDHFFPWFEALFDQFYCRSQSVGAVLYPIYDRRGSNRQLGSTTKVQTAEDGEIEWTGLVTTVIARSPRKSPKFSKRESEWSEVVEDMAALWRPIAHAQSDYLSYPRSSRTMTTGWVSGFCFL
uniref:Uncharacterized protein n=1 Tax=Timema monikensis TaxID=170555 RepID=A0A7R9HQQ0_9NEOP|nr:unnamed protein product [Timema monikensis]